MIACCSSVYVKEPNGRLAIEANGGKRFEYARLIAAIKIGRPILAAEVVHHINGDPSDNRFENLEVLASHREHFLRHGDDMRRKRWDKYYASTDSLCAKCSCKITQRTCGCLTCSARHRRWERLGLPFEPPRHRRKLATLREPLTSVPFGDDDPQHASLDAGRGSRRADTPSTSGVAPFSPEVAPDQLSLPLPGGVFKSERAA